MMTTISRKTKIRYQRTVRDSIPPTNIRTHRYAIRSAGLVPHQASTIALWGASTLKYRESTHCMRSYFIFRFITQIVFYCFSGCFWIFIPEMVPRQSQVTMANVENNDDDDTASSLAVSSRSRCVMQCTYTKRSDKKPWIIRPVPHCSNVVKARILTPRLRPLSIRPEHKLRYP